MQHGRYAIRAEIKIILRPLPYEVLLLLLQRDEPVSREELFAHCWQGMVVTDQALTNVISGLRRNFFVT
ncbi:winged helix-turn-helix domain-containing protein [Vibrio sinaloensis]|nr:winged helix-turn-helix domain-containing protein [Vibrio sinaloensis]